LRVAWATDPHLDTVDRPDIETWCGRVSGAGATALLLSGDISEAEGLPRWLSFLESRLPLPIYFVLGNHDYYGSDVATVREAMRRLNGERLHYLSGAGGVLLAPGVSLVGCDGWGDCRLGAIDEFEILTDYLAIGDLAETIDREELLRGAFPRVALREALQRLGDEAAAELRPDLLEAAGTTATVLVLTHVPPFREACWHRGSISGDTWLPGFTCKAVGDLLLSVAESHPDRRLMVLCGHTHGSGYVRMRPNLEVYTGAGGYGALGMGTLEARGTTIRIEAPTFSPRPD